MINEQKPDIIHVLTPPDDHASISIMAMNQGCHVLVEKPMALTVSDAKKMVEVAKQNNVHLCVDHSYIFEDVVQRAIQFVSTGKIGEVISVQANLAYDVRRKPAFTEEGAEYCHWSYRMNGGPVQDLMPHPASLVMEFVSEIREVQSVGLNRGLLPNGWQDEIRVLLKSDSVTGYISISFNEKPDATSLTIKGTKGLVHGDLFSGIVAVQKQSSLPRAVRRGLSGCQLTVQNLKGTVGSIYKFVAGRIDKSGGIESVISKFYDAIRNQGEPPVSLDKSIRVVDLMNRVWPAPILDVAKQTSFVHPSKKHTSPTALVTGGSGFIGSHLIKKLLSQNIGVRALVRSNSIRAGRLTNMDIDIIEGDLGNPDVLLEATKGIEVVFHVGAAVNNDWAENIQSNINGTEYLIKAAIEHKVERFVHISTTAVYDYLGVPKGAKVTESSPCHKKPKDMGAYAYSKIEAERMVSNAYENAGLRTTIIRPGMVIGPNGRIFFPHMGYRYQDKLFFIIGKGDRILPLTYVENTVDGIYRASVERNAIGQIYNLIDDGEIAVREYLERFLTISNGDGRIITLPYTFVFGATATYEIAALIGVLKNGVTSRRQLKSKQADVRFDNTKAKTELKWSPHISIDEGLTKTFEWHCAKFQC